MIAVGLWAAQLGGRSTWLVPLTFVSVMALGGFLGVNAIHLPFIEQGIVLSVLTLGILITVAARLSLILSLIIVGLFAICHGHAHGAEMPATASGELYGLGFIFSTILLHVCGIGFALAFQKLTKPVAIRCVGDCIVFCGVLIILQR